MKESDSAKKWTINVVVDSEYLDSFAPKTGDNTWESPLGAKTFFGDHVILIATNNLDHEIVIGNADGHSHSSKQLKPFVLPVYPGDTVQWVVSEMNAHFIKYHDRKFSIAPYGFKTGSDFHKYFTSIGSPGKEGCFVHLLKGFDWEHEPQKPYLECTISEITVPTTTVKTNAPEGEVSFLIKLLVVDTTEPQKPSVDRYVIVDPKFQIKHHSGDNIAKPRKSAARISN